MPPASGTTSHGQWVRKLEDICRTNQMVPPVFNIISDRRGGRTAWSSTVTLARANGSTTQRNVQARFWYDGQFIENAKEDAAEVAVQMLTQPAGAGPTATAPSAPGSAGSSSASSGSTYGSYNSASQYGTGSARKY